jgi:hypothetical protein
MVGHRTIGLNLSIGRGATATVFARRALRRLNLRPGCTLCQILFFICCPSCAYLPGRSELEPVVANPCGNLPFKSAFCPAPDSRESAIERTVMRDLLIMLDCHRDGLGQSTGRLA